MRYVTQAGDNKGIHYFQRILEIRICHEFTTARIFIMSDLEGASQKLSGKKLLFNRLVFIGLS